MRQHLIPFIFACFLSTAAYAGAQDTLNQWQYVQDPDSGALFEDISRFISEHPGWPDQKRIRIRAERAMRGAGLSDEQISAWFENNPPLSGVGKWSYAEVKLRQDKNEGSMARRGSHRR